MAGFIPAIHVLPFCREAWITGTSPVMTKTVFNEKAPERSGAFSFCS
jgi:hypothetical protein